MKLNRILLAAFLFISCFVFSQNTRPVKWTFSFAKTSDSTANLYLKATMENNWHVYSQHLKGDGPVATTFDFKKSNDYQLIGEVYEPKAIEEYDANFAMTVKYFSHAVTFMQAIKILSSKAFDVKGTLNYMCCDNKQCLPPEDVDFTFTNIDGYTKAASVQNKDTLASVTDSAKKDTSLVKPIKSDNTENAEEGQSLFMIFLFSLLAGFAAVFTPCVFPMIPMTVTFFLRKAEKKSRGRKDAIVYGLSIIVIYVALGLGLSLIFGADAMNSLSTNAWFNIFLFLLLIVFAASFFGAFEIMLPASWSNAMDRKADKSGGYVGVFFMALTFVLVSFSCTSPIIGTLLVQTAVSKNTLAPFLGMLGFSTALAIPFTLFAIFPAWLKSLPKSGGWMNSVKVTLAFILLALSLKFLTTASLVNHWGIMNRDIFLAVWIVIFILLGMYLLGKLKFAHDSDLKHISVARLFLAIISFSFAMYLVPGMWGAELKVISAFSPPLSTQDFIIFENASGGSANTSISGEPKKYTNIFKAPHGLTAYFDYEEGMVYAKKMNKPAFIDFTGWGCTNCKKMEGAVLTDKKVMPLLNNDYVMISLYTDDKTIVPANEQFVSKSGGGEKKINTIGKKNKDIQEKKFGTIATPYYALLDTKGDTIGAPKAGYDDNVDAFVNFLEKGIKGFGKRGKK